jgi:hypothetical protein
MSSIKKRTASGVGRWLGSLPWLAAALLVACASGPDMHPSEQQQQLTQNYFNQQLAALQARTRQTPWSAWGPMGQWGAKVQFRKRDIPLQGIDLFCNHIKTLPYGSYSLYPSEQDGLVAQGTGEVIMSAQYGDESQNDPTKGLGVILHLPLQCRLHTDNFLRQVEVRQTNRFFVRVLPGDSDSTSGGPCEPGNRQCVAPNQMGLVDMGLVETAGDPINLTALRATPPGGWEVAFPGHDEEPLASLFTMWNGSVRPPTLSILNQATTPVKLQYCVVDAGKQAPKGCEKRPNGGSLVIPAGKSITVRMATLIVSPSITLAVEQPGS